MLYCIYCGSKQHTITNCNKTAAGQQQRASMYCSYCGSRKHKLNACPKTFNGNATRALREDEAAHDFIKD